jgi:adenylate cyclase
MLFVDVRGSTSMAEKMSAREFGNLMNAFYEAVIKVLVNRDAFIDKLVGDEVTALFIPGYAGREHAHKAVEAGEALLHAAGYGTKGGAWIPIGVGIHTGPAWVGSIVGASGDTSDFTALGDNVNIAARLASEAGPGEILASQATMGAAGVEAERTEERHLELKGRSEALIVNVLSLQGSG